MITSLLNPPLVVVIVVVVVILHISIRLEHPTHHSQDKASAPLGSRKVRMKLTLTSLIMGIVRSWSRSQWDFKTFPHVLQYRKSVQITQLEARKMIIYKACIFIC